MSTPSFTLEFKDGAVRQFTERTYSFAEVSAKLGVPVHSLYKLVSAVRPDKTDQQAKDLIAAKSEILRLRGQLHLSEEKREIIKKGRSLLCKGTQVKYRFINEHRNEYDVEAMSRLLKVVSAGFYA